MYTRTHAHTCTRIQAHTDACSYARAHVRMTHTWQVRDRSHGEAKHAADVWFWLVFAADDMQTVQVASFFRVTSSVVEQDQ